MYVLQWIMLHRKYVYEIMILCYGLRDYATMNYDTLPQAINLNRMQNFRGGNFHDFCSCSLYCECLPVNLRPCQLTI